MRTKDRWFNDGIKFFGLYSAPNVTVFKHPHLVLKAASWYEMLAHKIHAQRNLNDFNDAVAYLKVIKSKDKKTVYNKTLKYKPLSPIVTDKAFHDYFESVWQKVYGNTV